MDEFLNINHSIGTQKKISKKKKIHDKIESDFNNEIESNLKIFT